MLFYSLRIILSGFCCVCHVFLSLVFLSLIWKRLLRDTVRAPDSSSCPEEASASKPAQEGFWLLWDVLFVWPWRVFLSRHVLSCLSSPGGLLIPPNFPREILGGCRRFPAGVAGPRDEATAMKGHLPWPPELPAPPWPPELLAPAMAFGAPSSAMASRAPSSAMASFVCSTLEVPVLCSCPCLSWGASRAPTPPSPVELLRRGTRLPGGGSYVRVLLCVSCVPASCVHIWFGSGPC